MPQTRSASGRQTTSDPNAEKAESQTGHASDVKGDNNKSSNKTQTTLDDKIVKETEAGHKNSNTDEARSEEKAEVKVEEGESNKGEATAAAKRQTDGTENGPASKKQKLEETNSNTVSQPENENSDAKDERGDISKSNNANGGGFETSTERKEDVPPNILEKGIIYFFTRARVNEDHPESAQDLQRTYFVLRPLAKGAKITDGPIEDSKTARLVALPKKVFPKASGRDKYLTFVEKVNCSMEEMKKSFFGGNEYSTATAGVSHTPPVTPVGEGVYAITSIGRDSHFAYMLTIPSQAGEVQEELGIRNRASYIISMRNPTTPAPKGQAVPRSPDYPQKVIEKFRGLRWAPAEPEYMNYENAQMLLIAESDPESSLAASSKDDSDEHKSPYEELERLEHEDEARIQNMKGDLSIFEDLHISSKEYPKVKTTW